MFTIMNLFSSIEQENYQIPLIQGYEATSGLLGGNVSAVGYSSDMEDTASVQKFEKEKPNTVREVGKLLGFLGYYRQTLQICHASPNRSMIFWLYPKVQNKAASLVFQPVVISNSSTVTESVSTVTSRGD